MASGSFDAQRAAIQFFETDRLLGLSEAPVSAGAVARRSPVAKGVDRTGSSRAKQAAANGPANGLSTDEKSRLLRVLNSEHVTGCTKCRLSEGRTKTVFGVGNPDARLVFVGEGPGFEEDRCGEPFVGRAGRLLDKMIVAMGLHRKDVYICNVVKCRPPNNRDPEADEIAACSPYLFEQLQTIGPEVIVALGAPASRTLLQTGDAIGRLRGRFHDFQVGDPMGGGGVVPLMPTYHPAYLLRSPNQKGKTWADLQMVMARLGLSMPPR